MSDVETVVTVETVTDIVSATLAETVTTVDTVSTSDIEIIAEAMPLLEVLETYGTELISETAVSIDVITEGTQGPPGPIGPAGVAEEDMAYARRLDMVSESVMYKAEAATGSVDTDPVWRIRKVTLTMVGALVDVSEQWADGDALFDNVWDDRALLTYI